MSNIIDLLTPMSRLTWDYASCEELLYNIIIPLTPMSRIYLGTGVKY